MYFTYNDSELSYFMQKSFTHCDSLLNNIQVGQSLKNIWNSSSFKETCSSFKWQELTSNPLQCQFSINQ